MTKHRDRSFLLRQLCWLSLGLCLVAGLCAQPIKRSMAYVTSLSATCVNTFVGEGQATLPTSASTSSETTGTTEAPPPQRTLVICVGAGPAHR